MPAIVYLLCALTSLICAALLLRGYSRRRVQLLFWSGLGFFALALSNVLLFVDLILVPNVDLAILRNVLTLAGLTLLLHGLIGTSTRP